MHGHQEQGRRDHRAVTYTQDAGDAGTQVTHGVARRGRGGVGEGDRGAAGRPTGTTRRAWRSVVGAVERR
jgi:hypothetical protein